MVAFTRKPGFKIAGIAILALLLLIPLLRVQFLISERQSRQYEAEAQLAQQWGAAQTLAPAYLVADIREAHEPDGNFVPPLETHARIADDAHVTATVTPETRHRGMFDIVVYDAVVRVRARIALASYREFRARAEAGTPVRLRLAVSDPQGIRKLDAMSLNGVAIDADAAGPDLTGLQAIEFALPADFAPDTDLELAYTLQLAGTRELRVLPLARAATVAIDGSWADPSYLGAHLPIAHGLKDGRFDARWRTSTFSRSYPQQFTSSSSGALASASFGVALYQPASVYQQNERSGKYGILVIALVFTAMFLFEIMAGLLLHPIQYLLVGAALALFYLLLLALSEHTGFGVAYGIAGAAAVLLVGGYASAALRSLRRGLMLAALQATAYGVFYVLVRSEDNALLLGAATLFGALAAVMWLTRRTDWYSLGARPDAVTASVAGAGSGP